MSITEVCARKLKMLRETHNYTQDYVANELDISQNAYSLIEKAITKITLDRVERLAQFYKVNPSLLINDENIILSGKNEVSNPSNFPPTLSTFEKRMYEQTITRMEVEIDRLYSLLTQLTSKLKDPVLDRRTD